MTKRSISRYIVCGVLALGLKGYAADYKDISKKFQQYLKSNLVNYSDSDLAIQVHQTLTSKEQGRCRWKIDIQKRVDKRNGDPIYADQTSLDFSASDLFDFHLRDSVDVPSAHYFYLEFYSKLVHEIHQINGSESKSDSDYLFLGFSPSASESDRHSFSKIWKMMMEICG